MYHAMLPTMIFTELGLVANQCYLLTHRESSSLPFFIASVFIATNVASAVWEMSKIMYDKNKVTEQM